MKHVTFWSKAISLVLVLVVLFSYQHVAIARAAVVAENEAKIAETEAYNREILRQIQEASEIYVPGTYEGEGQGFGGAIRVRVTVSATDITDIAVLSHANEDQTYYVLAESLVDTIVQRQTTDVDTVSGATFSSLGILDAVNAALKQAVK